MELNPEGWKISALVAFPEWQQVDEGYFIADKYPEWTINDNTSELWPESMRSNDFTVSFNDVAQTTVKTAGEAVKYVEINANNTLGQ